MRALENFGSGADGIQALSQFADIFFVVVLAINGGAMLPIMLSNPPCRKRLFDRDEEGGGCCNCIASCAQTVFGPILSTVAELAIFLSWLACLGISYVFL